MSENEKAIMPAETSEPEDCCHEKTANSPAETMKHLNEAMSNAGKAMGAVADPVVEIDLNKDPDILEELEIKKRQNERLKKNIEKLRNENCGLQIFLAILFVLFSITVTSTICSIRHIESIEKVSEGYNQTIHEMTDRIVTMRQYITELEYYVEKKNTGVEYE